MKGAN